MPRNLQAANLGTDVTLDLPESKAFTKARALEAEGSWTLAHEAYVNALDTLTEPKQRRWCELFRDHAAWQAASISHTWALSDKAIKDLSGTLGKCLKDYDKAGNPKDDLWIAAMSIKLALIQTSHGYRVLVEGRGEDKGKDETVLSVGLTLLDHLAAAMPTRTNAVRWLEALRLVNELAAQSNEDALCWRLAEQLNRAASCVQLTRDEQAWCRLAHTLRTTTSRETPLEDEARWQTCLQDTRDTLIAPLARGYHFLYEVKYSAVGLRHATRGPSGQFERASVQSLRVRLASLLAAISPTDKSTFAKSLREELVSLEKDWSRHILETDVDSTITPGAPLRLLVGEAGVERLTWSVFKCPASTWLKINHIQHDRAKVAKELQDVVPLCFGSVALPAGHSLEWGSASVALVDNTQAGLYVISIKAEFANKSEERILLSVCSSLAGTLQQGSDGKTTLWLENAATAKPLSDADIFTSVFQPSKDHKGRPSLERTALHTNAQGAAELPTTLFANEAALTLIAEHQGNPVVIGTARHWPQGGHQDFLVADLFSERGIYRPGETVHWRLFLRHRKEGAWRLPEEHFTLSITHVETRQRLLHLQDLKPDDVGSLIGELALPVDLKPGQLSLSLNQAKPASKAATCEEGREILKTNLCLVDNFVPPTMSGAIELISPPADLRPGRKLVGRVNAQYLSGGPVQGADVALSLWIEPSDPYAFTAHQSFEDYRRLAQILKEQGIKGTTGADGGLDFSIQIPETLPGINFLRFRALITPANATAYATETKWTLSPAGALLKSIDSPSHLCTPGKTTPYVAHVVDGLGKPYTGAATLEIRERRWREIWLTPEGRPVTERPSDFTDQNLPEPDDKGRRLWKGWELLSATMTYPEVSSIQLQASASGRVEVPLLMAKEGVYETRLWIDGTILTPPSDESTDHWGASAPGEDLYYAVTRETRTLALQPGKPELITQGAQDHKGSLPVLLVSPNRQSSILLSVSGDTARTTVRIEPGRQINLVEAALPKTDSSTVSIQAHFNGEYDGQGLALSSKVTLPPQQAAPRLEIAPLGEGHRPGEEVELNIRALSKEGKGLKASLALSLCDDALNLLAKAPGAETPLFGAELEPGQVHSQGSARPIRKAASNPPPSDPRRGLRTDENIILSPFELRSAEERGYGASSTLAGTRIRTSLSDIGSAISVITSQFLKDAGATNNQELLAYTSNTEISGAAGNFAGKPSLFENGTGAPAPVIRRHFGSTALWLPDLRTDADGRAVAKVKLPDNLTRWQLRARGMALGGHELASVSTTFEASMPLQARIQTPRFLVEGDSLELGTTLVNRSKTPLAIQARLSLAGPLQFTADTSHFSTDIPALGEARHSWLLKASAPGTSKLLLDARSLAESDASEQILPIKEDGERIPTAVSGVLALGADEQTLTFEMPTSYDPKRSVATVQLSPSIAGAMIDALPYLIDYPYGCIEQTMSRFMPAVAVRETLTKQGWKPEQIEARIRARVGKGRTQQATLAEIDKVVADSLTRLADGQGSDGGFGWWPGSNWTDLWMSAYVKWGLVVLRDSGQYMPAALAERVDDMEDSLNTQLLKSLTSLEHKALSTEAWALAALSRDASVVKSEKDALTKAFARIYDERVKLTVRGRACLAIAAASLGNEAQQQVLLRNLLDGCTRTTDRNLGELAQWGIAQSWLYADDSPAECTALTLIALERLQPQHPLAAPAAHWLALNRLSGNWSNTRATSFCIQALSLYLLSTGEAAPDAGLELELNGKACGRVRFDADTLAGGPVSIPLIQTNLHPGTNTLTLRRLAGSSTVFADILAETWATGEGARAGGNLLALARGLTEQVPAERLDGKVLLKPRVVPLGATVGAGRVLHATIALRAPQTWEYLMVRIPKAAGCEPLNPLSGWDARLSPLPKGIYERIVESAHAPADLPSGGRTFYREEHDDCSLVFIDELPAGDWLLTLPLQAVHAGDFRLLPATIECMYVPAIRANTAASRLRISR